MPQERVATDGSTTGALVTQLSEQTSRLVHDEIRLAQAELKEAAKHAVVGAGLFSAAGIAALYATGVLIAAGVAALALVLPLWASALIIGFVLLVCAGIAALVGKRQVGQASPAPRRTVDSVKRDVSEIKEAAHHDGTP